MSEQIRVLHVLGGLEAGGAENFVMNLYRAIDRNKVQFDFIKHTKEKQFFDDEIVRLGGRIFTCPKYNGKNHFAYCEWWRVFLKEHPEYRVVHGHVRSTAAIYLWIAKKLGRVTISHSHSTSNGKGAAAFVKDVMQLPIRYIADYMFACSDEAGKYLFGKAALKKENYKLIPNAIDCDRFKFNPQRREEMRKELGLDDCFVIGHVGRLSEPKNHTFLLDVFAEVEKEKPEARLLLVGDGPLRETLKEKCTRLGISEKVLFVGARQNTEDYYQTMDIFAFPSLWEGLGIVAIEAQAARLKCICSDQIPSAVKVTEELEFYPLDQESWKMRILNASRVKYIRCREDIISMFDIKTTAENLQRDYVFLNE